MNALTPAERFRRWHLSWKEQVCDEARPFSHGMVLRSRRHPDFWEYSCLRLDRPLDAVGMIAAADRELSDCAHRFVEWTIPMPDDVIEDLRRRGWMARPLVYLLHDGRPLPDADAELVEVDYDAVSDLRDIWHREDFGEHTQPGGFQTQARDVAELAGARVIAAVEDGRPVGFAEVETHDGGSDVAQVFVHPQRRGAGLGTALTTRAIALASASAPDVWIGAERDGDARRLYERLGFHPVAEAGVAILLPRMRRGEQRR